MATTLAKAAQVIGTHDLSEVARNLQGSQSLQMPQSNPERDKVLTEAGMLNNAPFSPGQPMPPFYPAMPPRQQVYNIGVNTTTTPRANSGMSFGVLRQMTRIYDIARACINVRIEELTHLDWDIVPRQEEDKGKYDDKCREIRQWLQKPDGVMPVDRWIAMAAEDWLSLDALSIYRHYSRKGDKLVALEIVDGSTVKPLLDIRGRIPLPPTPAFEQWMWGIKQGEYNAEQLLYRPYWVRSDSPYGLPPMETLLMNANSDIKLQLGLLYYWTQGNIPEGFGSVPESWSPEQIREFQEYWDAMMAGNEAAKHAVKFVPGGFNFNQFRQATFDDKLPMHLLQRTCALYGVSPQELGFVQQINKAQGEMQENVQHRRSLKPSTDFFASIFDEIIAEDFGAPQLAFKFLGVEEQEDALTKAQIDEIHIRNGVISPDEVRSKDLGLQVDAKRPAGRIFMTASGPVPIELAYGAPAAETATQPDAKATGDQQDDAAATSPSKTPQEQPEDDAGAENPDEEENAPQKPNDKDGQKGALGDDLRKWQRKATDRVKAGKRAACQFESAIIPPATRQRITTGLEKAATADDVRAVFAKGPAMRATPPPLTTGEVLRLRRALGNELSAFLLSQGQEMARLITAARDPLAILNSYDWAAWLPSLRKIGLAHLVPIFELGAAGAADELTAYGSFSLPHEAAEQYAERRAAELVGKRLLPDGTIINNPNPAYAITGGTRDWLRQTIEQGLMDGLSMDELADRITADRSFTASRAMMIARTETGTAYNRGSIAQYRESGVVGTVEVIDGDGCPECEAVNGQIWTLEEAEMNPLEHPNCIRAFIPIVNGEA